ncbi:hypothetical protein BKA66DRAFT_479293 [Pyrenochaeta sp. MPI-SDFR-AT-0127]|nr:hypothetical protein BKA66DRAFT_479293 [Pyrenochaeta sp. MPI-SDFR-AT-0127]
MQLTTLFALALVSGSSLVAAANCQTGLHYCGYSLLARGNYFDQILAELKNRGQPTGDTWIRNSLFYCKGGSNGDLIWQHKCTDNRCVSGGSNSDHCE